MFGFAFFCDGAACSEVGVHFYFDFGCYSLFRPCVGLEIVCLAIVRVLFKGRVIYCLRTGVV